MNRLRTGRLVISSVLVLSASHCGCAPTSPHATPNYSTVAPDPRRNADVASGLNAKGISLLERGEWSKAEEALRLALEADVTFGPAHNNLGKIYFHDGKLYLAAWEFQYAAKLMPNQPEPKNNLGLVLERAGKLDDAVANYDNALGLEPDNAQILGNAARCRVRRGDTDAKTSELLEKLVLRDTRADWSEWAKEQLALRGRAVGN